MNFKRLATKEYQRLIKCDFGPFSRGDIVLTNCHDSIFAKLIRLKGRVDSNDCKVNHAELYIGSGTNISAELTINIHPIKKFFKGKHDVYVFHNIAISQEQRNAIVAESLVHHGKLYDVLGIIGQAISFLTRSDYFAKLINSKSLLYCSEFLAKIHKKILSRFIPSQNYLSVTPDNIFDFCMIDRDWICSYKLVKNDLNEKELLGILTNVKKENKTKNKTVTKV